MSFAAALLQLILLLDTMLQLRRILLVLGVEWAEIQIENSRLLRLRQMQERHTELMEEIGDLDSIERSLQENWMPCRDQNLILNLRIKFNKILHCSLEFFVFHQSLG